MSVVIRADWGIGKQEFYERRESGYGYRWCSDINDAMKFETLGDAITFIELTWNGITTKIVAHIELLDAETEEVLHGFGNKVQSATAGEGGDTGIIANE